LRRRALLLAVSPARALSLPLHDALPICRVLGADVDLHAVQAQIPEREVGDHGDRSRRDALPRALMAHPIPDRPRTCRSPRDMAEDRKSTRLNSSHVSISYAVFCLKKKTQ